MFSWILEWFWGLFGSKEPVQATDVEKGLSGGRPANDVGTARRTIGDRGGLPSREEFSLEREMNDDDLERFIRWKLKPDKCFNSKADLVVDTIKTTAEIPSQNIIIGGSRGKDTAIRGSSDIDLVIVLDYVKSASGLKDKLPEALDNIEQHLSKARSFHLLDKKEIAMACKIKGGKVDILPTFSFTEVDKKALYKIMIEDKTLWRYYRAAFEKLKVEFVKKYPENVKDLIRLVKFWNKNFVKDKTDIRQPNSYAMELITIHVWEKAGKPSRFGIKKAFRSVMERLMNVKALEVIWFKNYGKNMIPKKIKKQRPLLMDPANPTNNVDNNADWGRVEMAAKTACEKPLLKGVTPWRVVE